MRLDANGAHARTATPVRNAEGLVQVEVRYIPAEVAWACQPHRAFMLAPST